MGEMDNHYADFLVGRTTSLPNIQGDFSDEEPNQSSRKGRSENFNAKEDFLLASAWLNVSLDPIVGIDQTKDSYWKRILTYYDKNKTFTSERSKKSLMHRWANISKDVSKMSGCYDRMRNRHESGKSDKDIFIDALALYKAEERKDFHMIDVWNLLHNEAKWINYAASQSMKKQKCSATSTPRSSSVPIGSNVVVDVEDEPPMERPIGRKRAKARSRSQAESESELNKYGEIVTSLKAEVETERAQRATFFASLMQTEEQSLLLKQKELDILQRKEDRKQREEEERIMGLDLSSMSERTRSYYIRLQDEILAKRMNRPDPSSEL